MMIFRPLRAPCVTLTTTVSDILLKSTYKDCQCVAQVVNYSSRSFLHYGEYIGNLILSSQDGRTCLIEEIELSHLHANYLSRHDLINLQNSKSLHIIRNIHVLIVSLCYSCLCILRRGYPD